VNPCLIIGLLLAWGASLGAVGWWQNGAGHKAERVAWQAREIEQNNRFAAATKKAEEDRRADEQAHAAAVDVIARSHAQEIEDARKQKDRDVAAARAGTVGLRFNASRDPAGGCKPSGPAAGAGNGDGGATTELPREIAADLFALADDADEVVRQLSACQAVVRADRVVQ
jgi:prophage endopeptidase